MEGTVAHGTRSARLLVARAASTTAAGALQRERVRSGIRGCCKKDTTALLAHKVVVAPAAASASTAHRDAAAQTNDGETRVYLQQGTTARHLGMEGETRIEL